MNGLSEALSSLIASFGAKEEAVWFGEETGDIALKLTSWHFCHVAAVVFVEINGRFYPNTQLFSHNLPRLNRFWFVASENGRWLVNCHLLGEVVAFFPPCCRKPPRCGGNREVKSAN